MLDVDHDVGVVDEYPSPVALALSTYRLGAHLPQRLLHGVHDRPDLPVVGSRAEQEGVGDHQLVGDVEGDHVAGLFVGGRLGGGVHELEGAVCGSHWIPSLVSVLCAV